MDRRRIGLLLIPLALLAAAVVPNLATKRIAGGPVIGPIPGPPAVGDCLLQPAPDDVWRISENRPVYQPLQLGLCTGIRFGEVAAVLRNGLTARIVTTTDPGGGTEQADPNKQSCSDAVDDYAGAPPFVVGPTEPNQWTAPFGFSFRAAAPSDLQVRFGQTWVACLVVPGSELEVAGVGYRDSVRGGLATGKLPPVLGSCLATASAIRPISCAQPHGAELFGSISTAPAGTTAALLEANCRALVRKYTGLADPTAGGKLAVQVKATHVIRERVHPGLEPPGDPTGFATCVVTPTDQRRALSGPLLGLGDGPLPIN